MPFSVLLCFRLIRSQPQRRGRPCYHRTFVDFLQILFFTADVFFRTFHVRDVRHEYSEEFEGKRLTRIHILATGFLHESPHVSSERLVIDSFVLLEVESDLPAQQTSDEVSSPL